MKKFDVNKLDISIPIRFINKIAVQVYPEDITREMDELYFALEIK